MAMLELFITSGLCRDDAEAGAVCLVIGLMGYTKLEYSSF